MKRSGAMMWMVVGAGLLYGAAQWLSIKSSAVLADVAQPSTAQTATPAPAPDNPALFPRRRLLMDYLRWQSLGPEERDRQFESQRQHEAEEWEGLLQFLKDNSPNRYLLVLRTTPSPRPGSLARVRLLQRWLNLELLQRTQPELYAVHVQQFREEDVVMGLAIQLRQARNHGDEGRADELTRQIHTEVAKLVDLGLHERAVRIQNLQALLRQEQGRLDQDMANKDQLVRQRADQIFQQADRAFGRRNQFPTSRPSAQ